MPAGGHNKSNDDERCYIDSSEVKVQRSHLTCTGLLLPPRSPGQNKVSVVILLVLSVESLQLVSRGTLLDQVCGGALCVQTLAQKVSGLAFVGLSQHGALETEAGQVLQRHAG